MDPPGGLRREGVEGERDFGALRTSSEHALGEVAIALGIGHALETTTEAASGSVCDKAHAPERHTRVRAIAIELAFSPAVVLETRARERHHEAESPRAVPALLGADLQALQLHAVA